MSEQLVIADAFPERDPELEQLVAQYLKAKLAEQKAKTASTARYDAIKARLELLELDTYHCYDRRYVALMKPEEAAVKVKAVKESAPSPYRPGNEQASAGAPPQVAE